MSTLKGLLIVLDRAIRGPLRLALFLDNQALQHQQGLKIPSRYRSLTGRDAHAVTEGEACLGEPFNNLEALNGMAFCGVW